MSKIELEEADRPEIEPAFLVPDWCAPRYENGEFIECGQCKGKTGSPTLCIWCLYVRERPPKSKEPMDEYEKDAMGLTMWESVHIRRLMTGDVVKIIAPGGSAIIHYVFFHDDGILPHARSLEHVIADTKPFAPLSGWLGAGADVFVKVLVSPLKPDKPKPDLAKGGPYFNSARIKRSVPELGNVYIGRWYGPSVQNIPRGDWAEAEAEQSLVRRLAQMVCEIWRQKFMAGAQYWDVEHTVAVCVFADADQHARSNLKDDKPIRFSFVDGRVLVPEIWTGNRLGLTPNLAAKCESRVILQRCSRKPEGRKLFDAAVEIMTVLQRESKKL